MEAAGATRSREAERPRSGAPAWVLALAPLLLIALAIGLFVALDGPGLGERTGPPAPSSPMRWSSSSAAPRPMTAPARPAFPAVLATLFIPSRIIAPPNATSYTLNCAANPREHIIEMSVPSQKVK